MILYSSLEPSCLIMMMQKRLKTMGLMGIQRSTKREELRIDSTWIIDGLIMLMYSEQKTRQVTEASGKGRTHKEPIGTAPGPLAGKAVDCVISWNSLSLNPRVNSVKGVCVTIGPGGQGSVTSKEWRTTTQKNGGPEPISHSATLKNGALQLKNGAPQRHTNRDISKAWRYRQLHVQLFLHVFPCFFPETW